ncbi:M48 family metalloprotease [Frateuria aurantia]
MSFCFRPPRLLRHLTWAGLAVSLAGQAQTPVRLPDLGSSADALVAPQQADLWGKAMFRQMRQLGLVLDDPLVDDRLEGIGHRLAAASDRPAAPFHFFLVHDPTINAFAAPGGYIAVNSGLVLLTRDEAELASVLAHEIGHITQDHLQRSFEHARQTTPLLGLVLLGAVAAGAAGAGDAGIATLAGGQGLLLQGGINFTRAEETEADAVGIDTLARAGYDPDAMARFFGRLSDQLRTDGTERSIPSLLQDHPVTARRIADAKAAAAALRQRPPAATLGTVPPAASPGAGPLNLRLGDHPPPRPDPLDYLFLRERVRVLSSREAELDRYYRPRLQGHAVADEDAYGAALNLIREDEGAQALHWLLPLQQAHPDDIIIDLAVAAARLHNHQRQAALSLYAALNRNHPEQRAVTLDYARALQEGRPLEAQQAAALIRPLLAGSDDPAVYGLYARACEHAGDAVRAGEAEAAASYYAGRPFDALEQFRRLLGRPDLDYYARARIQAQITQLTPLVLELSRRHIETEDNPAQASGH